MTRQNASKRASNGSTSDPGQRYSPNGKGRDVSRRRSDPAQLLPSETMDVLHEGEARQLKRVLFEFESTPTDPRQTGSKDDQPEPEQSHTRKTIYLEPAMKAQLLKVMAKCMEDYDRNLGHSALARLVFKLTFDDFLENGDDSFLGAYFLSTR